jgi:uncharacterized protein involved in type VI secretion and phage assembly
MTSEALVRDFYLTINGSPASAEMTAAVHELVAESTLNQPSMAVVTFFDPTLIYADDSKFAPGKTLKVEVESGSGAKAVVFDGEIVEVELDMRADGAFTLVRAFDKMHRLARGSLAQTFLNVKDSDVVSRLISSSGLTADVTATSQVYPYILQQAESNLDMIRRLAARNGYYIGVKNGKLQFKPLRAVGSARELEWGRNLYEFRPRMSGSKQLKKVSVRSWDMKKKTAIVGTATSETVSPKIGESISGWSLPKPDMLVPDATLPTQAAADARAGGLINRYAGALVAAEGLAAGDAGLVAGASVKVKSVGTRFAGTYIVTNARHRIDRENGYVVEFSVSGLSTDDIFEPLEDVPLAGFSGLMPAVVTNVDDPDDLGRVKVKLPWLGDAIESDWARVVAPGAGATRGIQFPPEVNDEVLVGFLQGSGDSLFVLGGLWNGTDGPGRKKAKYLKSGKIIERVILTRAGHEIALNDDSNDGGIVIKDSKGNEISIKVKEGLITIKTTGEIKITGDKGIALASDKDITIKAGGKLSLSSTGDMELDSKAKLTMGAQTEATLKAAAGKVALDGVTLEAKGKTGATIDGGAKFEIKGAMGNINGSGVLELKGGIIKLN